MIVEEVLQLIDRYKACVEAWRAHPDYDGNDRYPHVRACCRTWQPQSLSFSIDTLNGAYAQFARMAKQRILAEEVKFTIEPIELADPVDPWLVLDWWTFPTKAGNKYQAKQLFRELFPTLRPALTQACKMVRMPAHRHPDTKRCMPKKNSVLNCGC